MAKKQYLDLAGLRTLVDEIKAFISTLMSEKSSVQINTWEADD